ncbi:transcription factor domain-containing protein, partial [Piptocephalis cylindrospora]
YFLRARRLLNTARYGGASLDAVAALLFLSIYEMGSLRHYDAWMHIGMACRMAQDLGLQREVGHACPDWTKAEERRWVWWACFCLDRLISTQLGRPM